MKKSKTILNEQSRKIAQNTLEIDGLIEVVKYHTKTIKKSDCNFKKKFDLLFNSRKYLVTEVKINTGMVNILKLKNYEHDIRII